MKKNTTVNSRGTFYVYDGTVNNLTVNSDGYVILHSGSVLSGQIDLYGASEMYVVGNNINASKAVINFHTETQKTSDDFFINNYWDECVGLAGLQGGSYVITVDATQDYGIYKIAEGAAGFNKTVSVRNTSGTTLGTLTVQGGMLVSGTSGYA